MADDIVISISGDPREAKKALDTVEKELGDAAKAAKTFTSDVNQASKSAGQLGKSAGQLNSVLDATGNGIQKLDPSKVTPKLNRLGGFFDRNRQQVTEASRGIEDFIVVLSGGGGLAAALRAAGNNIAQFGASLGGVGAVVGSLTAVALPTIISLMGTFGKKTEENTEKLKEQKDILEQIFNVEQRRAKLLKQSLLPQERQEEIAGRQDRERRAVGEVANDRLLPGFEELIRILTEQERVRLGGADADAELAEVVRQLNEVKQVLVGLSKVTSVPIGDLPFQRARAEERIGELQKILEKQQEEVRKINDKAKESAIAFLEAVSAGDEELEELKDRLPGEIRKVITKAADEIRIADEKRAADAKARAELEKRQAEEKARQQKEAAEAQRRIDKNFEDAYKLTVKLVDKGGKNLAEALDRVKRALIEEGIIGPLLQSGLKAIEDRFAAENRGVGIAGLERSAEQILEQLRQRQQREKQEAAAAKRQEDQRQRDLLAAELQKQTKLQQQTAQFLEMAIQLLEQNGGDNLKTFNQIFLALKAQGTPDDQARALAGALANQAANQAAARKQQQALGQAVAGGGAGKSFVDILKEEVAKTRFEKGGGRLDRDEQTAARARTRQRFEAQQQLQQQQRDQQRENERRQRVAERLGLDGQGQPGAPAGGGAATDPAGQVGQSAQQTAQSAQTSAGSIQQAFAAVLAAQQSMAKSFQQMHTNSVSARNQARRIRQSLAGPGARR